MRALAEQVLEPLAAEVDARREFPRDTFRALGEAGLLGLMVPTADGGTMGKVLAG